ncbi:hypothetical protein ACQP0C_21655 [Nocardia sp. CA-129566]|uniref:hypothetical protein n=1 Tax=Nocardia sp. CA-129566 TaxID=3239976 RepID=UPI003D96CA6E
MQLILDGFAAANGCSLGFGTGRIAVAYMRMLSAFNREFEYRLATDNSLEIQEILDSEFVRAFVLEWEACTAECSDDPAVVRFMFRPDVAERYRDYIGLVTDADLATSVEAQLASIALDSGIYLVYLAELIGRVNRIPVAAAVSEEFRALGMAAKLADEIVDLGSDLAEGRYNLFAAHLHARPSDDDAVRRRLRSPRALTTDWLRENIPDTFTAYMTLFDHHYAALSTPQLRIVCDASMFRAAQGIRAVPRSRECSHVTMPPGQSWR